MERQATLESSRQMPRLFLTWSCSSWSDGCFTTQRSKVDLGFIRYDLFLQETIPACRLPQPSASPPFCFDFYIFFISVFKCNFCCFTGILTLQVLFQDIHVLLYFYSYFKFCLLKKDFFKNFHPTLLQSKLLYSSNNRGRVHMFKVPHFCSV
ncbi:hypothetical protein ILYODFUR_022573 [Ilyodon furcidens]|uniref:Uncharacterized protein n=1 Tax=Ilyodon furcidens TaxID=33524 RepID=A0ABV0U7J8_9TELE